MKKVAIQGQAASYHDQAAHQFFGNDIEIVACDNFKTTFKALETGKADYVVVAIENSLFGSINPVYDLLLKYRFWIIGEVYLRIQHCLIGLEGASVAGIREVHSQAEAIAQCEEYLDTKLAHANRFEHHDTAASVADVKKWNDPTKAAIGSEAAAKLYGLGVLKKGIETHHENYTRFVVLSKQKQTTKDSDKTSLVMTTANKPGALFHALGSFAKQKINLSKLQSRPIIGKAWHYIFYVDVDTSLNNQAMKNAISELSDQGCETIVLGDYKAAKY